MFSVEWAGCEHFSPLSRDGFLFIAKNSFRKAKGTLILFDRESTFCFFFMIFHCIGLFVLAFWSFHEYSMEVVEELLSRREREREGGGGGGGAGGVRVDSRFDLVLYCHSMHVCVLFLYLCLRDYGLVNHSVGKEFPSECT